MSQEPQYQSCEGKVDRCPICDAAHMAIFFEMQGIPVSDGGLWSSKAQARQVTKGDIRLAFCRTCGYIGNQAFDQRLIPYGQAYNASLEHSPSYRRFIEDLAQELIDRYNLRRRTVIEVACGSGEFLRILCQRGQNRGYGFDPSLPSSGIEDSGDSIVTFVQEFYSEQYAGQRGDFFCCRHLLSSVSDPKALVDLARGALEDRPGGLAYFEMPDARAILRDAIWNLTYEHCSYFTDISLTRFLELCGFEVLSAGPCFAGQYVGVVATPGSQGATIAPLEPIAIQALAEEVETFAERFRTSATTWQARLDDDARAGRRSVAWGAGGRAVSFLNCLEVEHQIEYVVDVNPSKQGTYIAGTGQLIVPPAFLRHYKPDVVILTNATFEQEIKEQLRELGIDCEMLTL
jgi:SAM-dependent methyltransferase